MCHGLDCVVNDTGLRTVILWTLIDLYCCVLYDRILERCHTLFCGGDYCGTMAARIFNIYPAQKVIAWLLRLRYFDRLHVTMSHRESSRKDLMPISYGMGPKGRD